MLDAFIISLRESIECSLLAAFIILYAKSQDKRRFFRTVLSGVLTAVVLGFSLGYIPAMKNIQVDNEIWVFSRYGVHMFIFFSGVFIAIGEIRFSKKVETATVFFISFASIFFESRAMGFLAYDFGAMKEDIPVAFGIYTLGILMGLSPLIIFKKFFYKNSISDSVTIPALFLTIGSYVFTFGGVGEFEKGNVIIALQKGLLGFVSTGIAQLREILLIESHPFIRTPFAGLLDYLSGDRTSMSLMVIFVMVPPIYLLVELFSKPEPVVSDVSMPAEKRLKIAFFRKGIFLRTIPIILSFFMLVYLIHSANLSLNPLYEPAPLPVKENEEKTKIIIPIADSLGDLRDGKLRKHVYYYGTKQIVMLAAMKPDGTIGFCLDECEVCRPAEWNKDAIGYAQKGDHLICKYCMTPIALPTLNNPGGCNPIPIPFKVSGKDIIVELGELIEIFKKVQALDKKGTHL